jgi:hypothetical protein
MQQEALNETERHIFEYISQRINQTSGNERENWQSWLNEYLGVLN